MYEAFLDKNKRLIKYLLPLILIFGFVLSIKPLNTFAAVLKDDPQVIVPGKDEMVDSKYSFIAQVIPDQTEVIPFDTTGKIMWEEITGAAGYSRDNLRVDLNQIGDAAKGHFGLLYKNVGRFGDKIIDLKVTVLDWSFDNYHVIEAPLEEHLLTFGRDVIAIDTYSAPVRIRYDFLEHDTDKPIKTNGFMTINDFDGQQSVEFSKETTTAIKNLYATSEACDFLGTLRHNGSLAIYSRYFLDEDPLDQKAMATILYGDADNLVFTWNTHGDEKSYDKTKPAQVESSIEKWIDFSFNSNQNVSDINSAVSATNIFNNGNNDDYGMYFSYIAKKPVKTAPIAPSKTITDSDESEVLSNNLNLVDEIFDYNIYQTVPDEWEEFYYSSYSLQDEINEILDVQKIKILNEQKTDVSGNFNISTNKNSQGKTVVKAEAKPEFIKTSNFYNHTYQMIINVKINSNADLSPYTDKEGNTNFPNKASVTIDNNSESSNEVDTTVKAEKPSAEKFVEVGENKNKSDSIEYNTEFKYLSIFKTPNYTLSQLELYDDLEDVFELKSARVLDSKGNDVTKDGILSLDSNTKKVTWKANNPSHYTFTTLSLEITCQLPSGIDISKYEGNKIPNVAHMTINDKDVPTDEVIVKPSLPPINVTIPKTGSRNLLNLLMLSTFLVLIGCVTSIYFIQNTRRKEK